MSRGGHRAEILTSIAPATCVNTVETVMPVDVQNTIVDVWVANDGVATRG